MQRKVRHSKEPQLNGVEQGALISSSVGDEVSGGKTTEVQKQDMSIWVECQIFHLQQQARIDPKGQ